MPSIRGTVHVVEPTKTFGQKGFRKRLVVLEQPDEKWTNYIPVEFTRDDCDSADDIKPGDVLDVEYELSGRKWQKDANSEVRYFVSLQVVRFSFVNRTQPEPQGQPETQQQSFYDPPSGGEHPASNAAYDPATGTFPSDGGPEEVPF